MATIDPIQALVTAALLLWTLYLLRPQRNHEESSGGRPARGGCAACKHPVFRHSRADGRCFGYANGNPCSCIRPNLIGA